MRKAQGIVLDIDKKNLILLTPDGDYLKVPHPGGRVKIGDEVCCRLTVPAWPKAIAAAACLAAALFLLIVVYPPGTPFSGVPWSGDAVQGYLVFEINPNFELAYNEKLEVTACRALNDDAVLLLEGLQERAQLFDAVKWLLERSVSAGYIGRTLEDNLVLVTLVQVGQAEILPEPLADLIEEQLDRFGINGYVAVFETDARTHQEAVTGGHSLNRYLVVEALRRQGGEASPLDDKPLADLLRELNSNFPGGLVRATGQPEPPPQDSPDPADSPGPPDHEPAHQGKPEPDPEEKGTEEQPARPGQHPLDPPGSDGSAGPHSKKS
ncbi:MAG: anti-sigma factor domain-containing protein [Bacillota bacterium]